MKVNDSAIARRATLLPSVSVGVWLGLLGVAAFSFTVPLTRLAVADGGMSPLFVGAGRAVVAAVVAAGVLAVTKQSPPRGRQWTSVAVVAGGAVVGFPLLTSFALQSAPAGHGAVVIAVLPAATAVVAVVRTREQTSVGFWIAAVAGVIAAVGFAVVHGGSSAPESADLMLLIAVVLCAIGYAEGGVLARDLGSWQTIAWALVLASPLMAILTVVSVRTAPPSGDVGDWAAFGYLGVVSMFLGFVAWYRGLAIGPMTTVSQVQLVQPVMSLIWASVLLGEHIGGQTVLGGVAVLVCALLAVRARAGVTGPRDARPTPSVPARRRDSGARTPSSTGTRTRCSR